MTEKSEVTLHLDEPQVIVRVMLTADRAIDDYLADCRRRRMSERTVTTYARTLDEFASRPDVRDLDVSKITRTHVSRFLATKSRLARGTVSGIETHLYTWFEYLENTEPKRIARNPMRGMTRTRRVASEDLDVLTVDADDVRRLLEHARPGSERNALAILAFLGPRRHAVATLRLRDYNRKTGELRFYEKGDKVIWKPVPHELRNVLDASIAAGDILPAPNDYLVPPEGFLQRSGDRDDRVVWRIVKKVAARAGVETHVHALRGAFAVYYLESFERDTLGLQELMGHADPKTTRTYLRRFDKKRAMEPVRKLSWGVALTGNSAAPGFPEFADKALESSPGDGGGRIRTSVPGRASESSDVEANIRALAAIERKLEQLRARARTEEEVER